MFYYKLQDGRTINLDHVEVVAPLMDGHGVRLLMTNGMSVLVLGDEWHDLEQLVIEHYTFHKELKGESQGTQRREGMTVYIIVNTTWNTTESVWDNLELARKAILNHAIEARTTVHYYTIIEHKLNQLKGDK